MTRSDGLRLDWETRLARKGHAGPWSRTSRRRRADPPGVPLPPLPIVTPDRAPALGAREVRGPVLPGRRRPGGPAWPWSAGSPGAPGRSATSGPTSTCSTIAGRPEAERVAGGVCAEPRPAGQPAAAAGTSASASRCPPGPLRPGRGADRRGGLGRPARLCPDRGAEPGLARLAPAPPDPPAGLRRRARASRSPPRRSASCATADHDPAIGLWADFALAASTPADRAAAAALAAAAQRRPARPRAGPAAPRGAASAEGAERTRRLDEATRWLRTHHPEAARVWAGWRVEGDRLVPGRSRPRSCTEALGAGRDAVPASSLPSRRPLEGAAPMSRPLPRWTFAPASRPRCSSRPPRSPRTRTRARRTAEPTASDARPRSPATTSVPRASSSRPSRSARATAVALGRRREREGTVVRAPAHDQHRRRLARLGPRPGRSTNPNASPREQAETRGQLGRDQGRAPVARTPRSSSTSARTRRSRPGSAPRPTRRARGRRPPPRPARRATTRPRRRRATLEAGKAARTSKVTRFQADDLKPGLFVEVDFRHEDGRNLASTVTVIRPVGGPDTPAETRRPRTSKAAKSKK